MKKIFIVFLALALLCSSALADHGSVQEWLDVLAQFEDIRVVEDANEAAQRILFEHYAASAEGVKVPAGNYTVGVDIPSGTYRIEYHGTIDTDFVSFLASNESTCFGFTSILGFTGASEIGKIELTDDTAVQISGGDVYFFYYTGIFH